MEWIKIQHLKVNLPKESGTKAVVYHGDVAWMYWNKDTETWHPAHGWRRNIGQPWCDVTAYMELPSYASYEYQMQMREAWDEAFSDEEKQKHSSLGYPKERINPSGGSPIR